MDTRWVAGVALMCVAGCGFPSGKLNEAKGHVQHALEVWKNDGKSEELASQAPPVEFHEALWKSGEKLVGFEMGNASYVDAVSAVRCEVKLTVRNKKGKERTENVLYDVTLGPPVKIVNNPMP